MLSFWNISPLIIVQFFLWGIACIKSLFTSEWRILIFEIIQNVAYSFFIRVIFKKLKKVKFCRIFCFKNKLKIKLYRKSHKIVYIVGIWVYLSNDTNATFILQNKITSEEFLTNMLKNTLKKFTTLYLCQQASDSGQVHIHECILSVHRSAVCVVNGKCDWCGMSCIVCSKFYGNFIYFVVS